MIARIGGWLGRHWVLTTAAVALSVALIATGVSGGSSDVGSLLLWLGLVLAYWLPAIVAWSRHVPNAGSVTVVNFFAWFLFVPWIIALAMAVRSRPPAAPPAPRWPDSPH